MEFLFVGKGSRNESIERLMVTCYVVYLLQLSPCPCISNLLYISFVIRRNYIMEISIMFPSMTTN